MLTFIDCYWSGYVFAGSASPRCFKTDSGYVTLFCCRCQAVYLSFVFVLVFHAPFVDDEC